HERRQPAGKAAMLAAALRRGDIQAVQELIHGGAKPHWSWVCETMRGGHLALAAVLLESDVERNVFTMAAVGDFARLTRRVCRVPVDAQLTASMEPASDEVTALHVGC